MKKKIFIVHDRIADVYRSYKHMTGMSAGESIPLSTLNNKFTRDKANQYITRDAKVITKTDLN